MTTYAAVLFAPDGDWVTDYHGEPTIDAVEQRLADQGSRWYFYPFALVIRDRSDINPPRRARLYGWITRQSQRIVSAPDGWAMVKGRSIKTVSRMLAALDDDARSALYDGLPLDAVTEGDNR